MSQGATDPTWLMHGYWESVTGQDSRFTNAGAKKRIATSRVENA